MRLVVAVILLTVWTASALAERRVALVLGADKYETIRPLGNAVNDARMIEDALDALGFEVYSESNRDLKRMRRALEDFTENAAGADVAFVFFAGHGVEIAGENRLLPTDADASSVGALKESSLPLEDVRTAAADAAKISLIVLDACRNDPFGGKGGDGRGVTALNLPDAVKPGLGRMGRADNTLFAFSAAPGETAADGEDGNSPFTTALTKYLGTEGLEIRSVLTLVQQEVYDKSRGTQLPYVESGLPRLFFASQASGELPERERLLLAMADIDDDIRMEVERIATDADMPLAPLYGALIGSELGSLNRTERTSKLREAAQAFTRVRNDLRRLSSSDERVTALRTQAEEQLSLGAFDTARAKLTEAANIDANSRETLKANLIVRTLSEAETHYLNGGAARAKLKYQLAIEDYQKSIALYEEFKSKDLSDTALEAQVASLDMLGDLYETTGNLAGARQAYLKQRDVARERLVRNPQNINVKSDLSITYDRLGDVFRMQGDLTGALEAFGESLAIRRTLSAADPDNVQLQRQLVVAIERVAAVRLDQRDLAGAREAFEESLSIMQAYAKNNPITPRLRSYMASNQDGIGNVKRDAGDLAGALASYLAALELRKGLAAEFPEQEAYKRDLVVSLTKTGDVRNALGAPDDALSDFEQGLKIAETLAGNDPENVVKQRDIYVIRNRLGAIKAKKGDLDAALEDYRISHALIERMTKTDPTNMNWQRDLSVSHSRIGMIYVEQEKVENAIAAFEASHWITERLAEMDPTNILWRHDLSVDYHRIGKLYLYAGQEEKAADAMEKAFAITAKIAADFPDDARFQRDLIISHFNLAEVHVNPNENYQAALDIVLDMRARGVLAEKDGFMEGLLREKLASVSRDAQEQ